MTFFTVPSESSWAVAASQPVMAERSEPSAELENSRVPWPLPVPKEARVNSKRWVTTKRESARAGVGDRLVVPSEMMSAF